MISRTFLEDPQFIAYNIMEIKCEDKDFEIKVIGKDNEEAFHKLEDFV